MHVSTPPIDRRLTPARGDLAAASLEGRVSADRFVSGIRRQVLWAIADLRESPTPQSRLESQLLFGESFTVYDAQNGWAWGQSGVDSYVGYAPADALGDVVAPTHRVTALNTLAFPAPDLKAAPHKPLSFGAKVTLESTEGRFARVAKLGWVFAGHLAPLDACVADWVATAERFAGAPYLWGGKSFAGVDCSGLTQLALESGGVAAPRDSDQQEAALGAAVDITPALSGLRRGDLVFWKGHVGVMRDAETLLHANAFHMQVEAEPLREAAMRIAEPISSIRRLGA